MLTVRQAVAEDALKIIEINVQTWKVAYKGLIPDEFLANRNVTKEKIERMQTEIQAEQSIHLVAVDNNEIIGFCIGGKARDKDLPYDYELRAIYVLPTAQCRGAGTALINAFRSIINAEFYCYALAGNANASAFYRKSGGVEHPEYARKLPHPQLDVNEICFVFHK